MPETTVSDTLRVIPQTPEHVFWWITIHQTVSLVALVLACVIFVMGYFAGGKENKNRILFSFLFASVTGILVMPLFLKAGEWLGLTENGWGVAIVIICDFIFIAAVAVNMYEIITVTAREARPPQ
jgi:hypothetical protein